MVRKGVNVRDTAGRISNMRSEFQSMGSEQTPMKGLKK
jgi:hypothetical protein